VIIYLEGGETVKIINCTPHPVVWVNKNGDKTTFEPSGNVPRLETVTQKVGWIGDIPMVRNTMGEVVGLPGPVDGVVYIVSFLVCQACPDRADLVAPDTTPDSVVRDENGRIVGVKRFQKV
jgi:hypothetical protein